MKTLSNRENFKSPQGVSTMRVWRPGSLQRWMDCGFTLKQAQEMAASIGDELGKFVAHNLVVNAGFNQIGDHLIDNESIGLTYHAIGTGTATPVSGDTALGTEVTRKAWTLRSRSGAVVSLSVFYLASECPYNIKECGVFGGSTASLTPGSGRLFSHYLQAYDNSVVGSQVDITFDYDLTIG